MTSDGETEADTKGTLAYHDRGLIRSRAMKDDGEIVGGDIGHEGVREPHIDAYRNVSPAERKLREKREKEYSSQINAS